MFIFEKFSSLLFELIKLNVMLYINVARAPINVVMAINNKYQKNTVL